MKAIIQKVINDGKHGPFVVATSEEISGSITFSLEPTVWQEEELPEEGIVVFLDELRKKRAGWRAKKARFWKLCDENGAKSMKIKGEIIRSGYDMRRAYDGVMYHNYEKDIPFSIFPEDGNSSLVVEICGKSFPYLFKTIYSNGMIEIDERSVFGMRISPISGKIGKILLDDQIRISHFAFSMTKDGITATFGDCRTEVFYEKNPGEIPDREKYSMTIWDRRTEKTTFESVTLSQEGYEKLKLEGLKISAERMARLEEVVSQAQKTKARKGLFSFFKKT